MIERPVLQAGAVAGRSKVVRQNKGKILGNLIAQNDLLILAHSRSSDEHTIYAVIVGEDPEEETFAADLAEAWNEHGVPTGIVEELVTALDALLNWIEVPERYQASVDAAEKALESAREALGEDGSRA